MQWPTTRVRNWQKQKANIKTNQITLLNPVEILARLAVVLVAVNCSTKRVWYQLRMVGDKAQEVFSLTRVRPIYRRCMAYLHPWEYSLSVQPALQALSAAFPVHQVPQRPVQT